MSGLSLLLPDYIDRDLHRWNRSSVLKPMMARRHPALVGQPGLSGLLSDAFDFFRLGRKQFLDHQWDLVEAGVAVPGVALLGPVRSPAP